MNLLALLYLICMRLIICCQSMISIHNNFYILFINAFVILSYIQKSLLTIITLGLINKFISIILEIKLTSTSSMQKTGIVTCRTGTHGLGQHSKDTWDWDMRDWDSGTEIRGSGTALLRQRFWDTHYWDSGTGTCDSRTFL